MIRLIVLASGKLGFSTIQEIPRGDLAYIFTDRGSTDIIAWANKNGIPIFQGNPRNEQNFKWLEQFEDCWILSINYLFIIPSAMIDAVQGKALNIHGSLLPKYRGRTPHVWAIINGETSTGVTVHFIVPEVDAGDIVMQEHIPINNEDTGGSLLEKYTAIYPILVNGCIQKMALNKIVRQKQDHRNATYFPKRLPADGIINWHWQKERIRNWIRSQTHPYPGAYTILAGEVVKIWHCNECNLGFDHLISNGTILKCDNNGLYIKCANSVVFIDDYSGHVQVGQTCESKLVCGNYDSK